MGKNIQRFFLAAIVGSLGVMTGCGQNNDSNMQMDKEKSWSDDEQQGVPKPQGKEEGDRYYWRSECNQ